MNNLNYILGEPILIKNVGLLHPLNIKEYHQYIQYFNVLSITTDLLLQQVTEKEQRKNIQKSIKNFDVICNNEEYMQILCKLISICFRVDFKQINIDVVENIGITIFIKYDKYNIGQINRDNYDYVRGQIIKCNNIKMPKQAKTKELQKWYDKAYKNKSKNNDSDLEDIITTIMTFVGYTPKQISELTIYQLNALIARINKLKEFDMNVQFLCVGAEKIKLEPYTAHIDLNEEDKLGSSFDEFKHNMGGVLQNNK